MRIFIKRLFNDSGVETGAILSVVLGVPTDIREKNIIEGKLIRYAFDILYPSQGVNIFRDMYTDTPSITVIKNINGLPDEEVNVTF